LAAKSPEGDSNNVGGEPADGSQRRPEQQKAQTAKKLEKREDVKRLTMNYKR